ncbi:hypothetical protein CBR_g258 [Chara braunii]|uniref:Retrotransposon gag domain-containing protein n=1 Tax=Chara braunii TaxID=69332 RepID=A0A388JM14_CHABU|nr:hypothetical protein CBR_g258 [Chara braunii]|eukprot:GBG58859.1 hypothetical protein CBR_g258 [Chara braunii]
MPHPGVHVRCAVRTPTTSASATPASATSASATSAHATSARATSAKCHVSRCHVSSRAKAAVPRQPTKYSQPQLMLRRSKRIAAREGQAAAAEQQLPLPLPSDMEAQGNPTVDNAASGSPREVCSTNPLVPQVQQEAVHTAVLQAWNFDPAETNTEPTAEEQTKSALANIMHQVILTYNWQQVELARQAHVISDYEETLKSLHSPLDVLEKDEVPHRHTASSSTDPSIRELEERMDHLVAQRPATISQQIAALQADLCQLQQQPTGTCNSVTSKQYKMPKFSIDKFDDYHKADRQGLTNELSIHLVQPESKILALYLCSTGASQVWLNHLAQTEGVEVAKLYTNITWEGMTEKWWKRFTVGEAQGKGANRIFSMHQGSQSTREWLTEWQKLETIPNLDIPFVHLCREFFQQSVDALSTTLGECSLYTDCDQIVDKAREVIQTNRWAANERQSQQNFVEKGKGPRTQPVAAVQLDGQEDDQALTHKSSEGDGVNALPPRPNNKKKKAKSASTTEAGQPNEPWKKFHLTEEQYKLRQKWNCCYWCNSTKHTTLEDLDPLTPKDFQWMPLPPFGSLPKLHCNALMAELRNYLHAAVPTPVMEDGVVVVDLRKYIAKIDREYTTQRYDNIDAPLLYVRIQIRKATCSALIDCGATRNYIYQDFMARAGLGSRVRRKSQPTQATLVDGPTHKSMDRCVDSVPENFGPHAREAVSFDILDTEFDMILGMSWLRSEDHPVNVYRHTVHVRDRNGVLVPCTVPPPHPSIGCHVLSAASIHNSTRNDVEEMGICFLHALPPPDAPAAEQPPDPRIVELLDSYGDIFEAPAGIVPNRPIRHEIILEDGAVPPHECIERGGTRSATNATR